jgi:hypothetical protein
MVVGGGAPVRFLPCMVVIIQRLSNKFPRAVPFRVLEGEGCRIIETRLLLPAVFDGISNIHREILTCWERDGPSVVIAEVRHILNSIDYASMLR